MSFKLLSPSFSNMQEIPIQYTGEGKDISPPINWSNPPKNTVCYALIVDDPDAPDPKAPLMTWVHWILFNIPADCQELKEDIPQDLLPRGALEGINDCKKTGYSGPLPPIGSHRYFFKLYALNQIIPTLKNPTKKDLEKAMEGHILAKAELIGTYEKKEGL